MISFQLNIFIEYYFKMIRIVIFNLDWSSSKPLGDRLADKRHGFLRKAFYPLADIPRYPTKNSNKMNKRHPLRRHQQLVGGSKMMSLTRLYFLLELNSNCFELKNGNRAGFRIRNCQVFESYFPPNTLPFIFWTIKHLKLHTKIQGKF